MLKDFIEIGRPETRKFVKNNGPSSLTSNQGSRQDKGLKRLKESCSDDS